MGYYTEFSLEIRKIKNESQFEDLVMEMKRRDLIGYAFDQGKYDKNKHEAYFGYYDSAKWYGHPEDMIHISEMFPNMYFELEGIGEEFGDYWREYWHDGECEVCRGEIVYEQPHKIPWQELRAF